ncbi:MAG: UvrD-helicase domain-containing protein, partial [Acidobacteriota bacterium]|nr:UvrD-helicase domain-containing protein [Acidobacteriota bacterium]
MSRNGLPRAGAGGDDLLSGLNPEQREAVLHRDGPLLILAGAGSGKTRVICHRLASLIGGGHAAADQILAVTFTNKAAEEMRARVERLLDSAAPRLWVSTFHAFCARLLRREGPRIGLSRDFVIYDGVDQLNVVRQAMKELNIDPKMVPPKSLQSRISQAKNRLESAADLRRTGESFADEQLAEVYKRYARALTSSQALDFDDLLLKTVMLFKESDETRARYGERFRYIMVDEYQDTNRPQYLLVRYLAERHRNLCVVGDPDQSIYKWRGADLRNILDFEDDFPETTVVRLERNYRSTQVILDAASGLIAHNRRRREKRLYTESAGGEPIVFHRANDDLEEADFILGRLRDAGRGAGRAAVLFRTNAQSRVIEEALGRAGIRYRVVGGVRFYERREIKDALAYLKLLLNPDDDISLRRVINVPPRGIGPGVMTGLEGIESPPVHDAPLFDEPAGPDAAGTGWSLWKRLLRATDEHLLPKRALTALSAFRTLMESSRATASTQSV